MQFSKVIEGRPPHPGLGSDKNVGLEYSLRISKCRELRAFWHNFFASNNVVVKLFYKYQVYLLSADSEIS